MDGTIISSDELKTWIEKMRQNYAVKMAKETVTELIVITMVWYPWRNTLTWFTKMMET